MKLNKKVCEKCRKRWVKYFYYDNEWNDVHDMIWYSEKTVGCSIKQDRSKYYIHQTTTEIPDGCPYRLEHIVLSKKRRLLPDLLLYFCALWRSGN